MERKKLSVIYSKAALLLLYIVLSVIFFLIRKSYDSVFWISFGFMSISFIFNGLFIAFQANSSGLKNYFYMSAVYVIGGVYLVVQTICSLAFVLLHISSVRITIILYLILFFVSTIICLLTMVRYNVAETAAENVHCRNNFIRNVTSGLSEIAASAGDRRLKKAVEGAVEEMQYSIPSDNEALDDIEMKIYEATDELKSLTANSEIIKAVKQVEKIKAMIHQRNEICKRL